MKQAIQLAEALLADGEPESGWQGQRYVVGMHATWLTEAEARDRILFFSGVTGNQDYTLYLEQEANLVRFFLALQATDTLYLFQEDSRKFVPVTDIPELIQVVTLGTRELAHYILYSPGFHALFIDAHDVAVVAFVQDGEWAAQVRAVLIHAAQENDLHLLR